MLGLSERKCISLLTMKGWDDRLRLYNECEAAF